MEDKKIKDKQQFLNKLISRVSSQDLDKIKGMNSFTNANT
jgi:hypothetical protein